MNAALLPRGVECGTFHEWIRAMKLTSYTDYALRTLMHLAANRDRLVTIQDIADFHGIAKNHLTKVVHQLGVLGVVETVRGRNGGLKLGKEPAEINIGDVVRKTETDFHMAPRFDSGKDGCAHTASRGLKGVLGAATAAYLEVLDGVTLKGLMKRDAIRAVHTVPVKSIQLRSGAKPAKR
jgi:Rrf2 family transcriptional regulator, nitric oxide-sensitive transcriptional repressor